MTRKELSRYYFLTRSIEKEIEQLRRLEALATNTGSHLGASFHGSGRYSDPTGLGANIADCRAKLEKDIARMKRDRKRIIDFIRATKDPYMKRILELRYLRQYTWQGVASWLGGNNTADSVRMLIFRYLSR